MPRWRSQQVNALPVTVPTDADFQALLSDTTELEQRVAALEARVTALVTQLKAMAGTPDEPAAA